ncbi:helix-turn-helix transcriptional regulator [Mycobacterium sp.]|uniref:helix-turn-helix transcriptional regulator n=1 Tax=Mycobacterium sp. TaxID=1785 RepID=UPI003F9B2555
MNTEPSRLLVPIPETLHALGIGRTKLYELFDEGKLLKINIGRRSFVLAKSIDSYVDSLAAAALA